MNQINQTIPEFYKGKSVFVTGGTGFLGKVLVEKLLRSCPEIGNIYLLIRAKKDKTMDERLAGLLSSQAFDILRENNPEALNKIFLIEGDTSKLGLGISNEDRQLLCDKVSVIFHSAATVKFVEEFKYSVNMNLRALDEMIKLGRELRNLESFVHISTAYSNWYQPIMKEEFYPVEYDPQYIIDLCNSTPDEELKKLEPKLFGKHVNVYTFTKSLAEDLAKNSAKDLAFAIVRPSIVGASVAEPYVGWVDSYTAGTPLVDQSARGVLRAFHCNKNNIFDVIPVDMVMNLAIAASWKTANDKASKPENSSPAIYNSVSGNTNPLTIQEMFEFSRDIGRRNPSDQINWYPQTRFYKSRLLYKFDIFLTHFIPALLSDFVDKLNGKNGRALSFHRKVQIGFGQVKFAMMEPINFHAENYQKLMTSMSKTDQKVFYFDPRSYNWRNYIDDFYFGIRKFNFHDKSVGSVAAQRKFARLKYTNYILSASILAFSLFAIAKANDRVFSRNNEHVSSSST